MSDELRAQLASVLAERDAAVAELAELKEDAQRKYPWQDADGTWWVRSERIFGAGPTPDIARVELRATLQECYGVSLGDASIEWAALCAHTDERFRECMRDWFTNAHDRAIKELTAERDRLKSIKIRRIRIHAFDHMLGEEPLPTYEEVTEADGDYVRVDELKKQGIEVQ